MKYINYSLLAAFGLILSACGNSHGSDKDVPFERAEGMIWNTSWHLCWQGDPALADSVRSALDSVGHTLSVFDPNSLVSTVNRQDSTPVNSDFIQVYVMSRKINKLSDGLFDPTLAPVIDAWGFGPSHAISPDTARIDSLMNFVGIDKTRLSHDALVKENPAIAFNFSAIAKGFGCDRVGEMLAGCGVKNYLVEIGGEILAAGSNPEGHEWRVSIDRPIFSDSAIVHDSQVVIAFSDKGMATSGNYRNFNKDRDGHRFGHTISALTGRPIQTDVLSATVLAPTAMEADALATAFMALGSERAMKINRNLRLPVMLILTDSVITSPQFDKLIKPQEDKK